MYPRFTRQPGAHKHHQLLSMRFDANSPSVSITERTGADSQSQRPPKMTDTSMGPPEISPMSLTNYPPILDDDDLLPSWSRDPSPPDSRRQRTLSGTYAHHHSPLDESYSFQDPLAPLSFSNVASLPSLSPKAVPTTPAESPQPGPIVDSQLSVFAESQPQIPTEDFGAELTEGLQRRDTIAGDGGIDDDGRIQVSSFFEWEESVT